MQLTIFDDIYYRAFYPLTFTRSIGDLRCGALKLRQRVEYLFGDEDSATSIFVEPRLKALYLERHPDWQVNSLYAGDTLYINSRLAITDESYEAIKALQPETALCNVDSIIAIRSSRITEPVLEIPEGVKRIASDLQMYEHIAQLITDNQRMLKWDFERIFYDNDNYFETETGVSVINPYNVWLGEGVKLAPNVVLDASEGPIIIDENTRIMAGSVLTGPIYIGKHCLIKALSKIYEGVTIGPHCKVGGEVENSIIQAYSNKQHDGFLGHAYLGEWVNIGADTNNSDLKNSYKNVKYFNYKAQSRIDSGTMFMGCVIGDHSKTGINSSLNTGLVVGCGCNIYGSELCSNFIPNFSWGTAESLTKYRFKAFLDTARAVKARRKLELGEQEAALYDDIYGV